MYEKWKDVRRAKRAIERLISLELKGKKIPFRLEGISWKDYEVKRTGEVVVEGVVIFKTLDEMFNYLKGQEIII